MSLATEFENSVFHLAAELKLSTNNSTPPCVSQGDLTPKLAQQSFTQDESRLREYSEMIAIAPSICQTLVDIVLASRTTHDDPEYDRGIVTAAANAISILNYGSRSSLFAFHFIDQRDWSRIRIPGANLNYAMLAHCNLDDADLTGASLINIILFGAQLRRINLSRVKTYEVSIFQAHFPSSRPSEAPDYLLVHPDGHTAVSESTDGRIRIFNIKTNEDIRYLCGHTSRITRLSFNRGGSYLASVADDRTVRIWDMSTYQCKSILHLTSPHDEFASCINIGFSPDNSRIVVQWSPNAICIGNVETSEWITTFDHKGVHDFDWHPSDDRILSCSNVMCIWDLETQSCIATWQVENLSGTGCSAKFTLDGTRIVLNAHDGVQILNATHGDRIIQLPKVVTFGYFPFALDSRYIYIPDDSWISVYDIETYQCVVRLVDTPTSHSYFLTADGQKLIVYCREPMTIKTYDVTSLALCVPTALQEAPWYHSLAFSPDNRHLVASNYETPGDLSFFDVKAGHCVETVTIARDQDQTSLLTYSPDGRFIALVSRHSPDIVIYDVNQRTHNITLMIHDSPVLYMLFNSTSALLASSAECDEDEEHKGDIVLWDTTTWKARVLRGHTSNVHQICFNPDGDILVSVSRDGPIRVWDLTTDTCRMQLGADLDTGFTTVAYSPCGRFIATGESNGVRIRIWNASSGKLMSTFRAWGIWHMVSDVAFLRTGQLIAIDGSYRIFDIFTGKSVNLGVKATHSSLCMSPDRSLMATRISQETKSIVYLWQFPRQESWRVKTLCHVPDMIEPALTAAMLTLSSIVLNDGNISVASSFDETGSIYMYSSTDDTTPFKLEGHLDFITCLHISSDGVHLVSGSRDRTLRLWSLKSRDLTTVFEGHTGAVSCVQFSPDNQLIASGSYDTTLRIWNVSRGKCVGQLDGHATPVNHIRFAPNNGCIASVGSDSHLIYLWDIASGSCITMLDQHTDGIFDIQFSADGNYLASASRDDSVRVWETKTGECIAVLKGHTACLTCFDMSSDGSIITTGSEDTTIRIWNVSTGQCSRVIKGHTGHVRSLCLTPDNRCVISASNDCVIHVWDIATGTMLHQLLGHTDAVLSVRLLTYDAEGESAIISTSLDHTVRLWTVTKMPLQSAYVPEMRSVIGAQESMDFTGADLTGAIMNDSFARLAERYRQGSMRWLEVWDEATNECEDADADNRRDEDQNEVEEANESESEDGEGDTTGNDDSELEYP